MLLDAGFVPLLDAAPLMVERKLGFAAEEGLELRLHREPSWSAPRDRLLWGGLQAAHMLAPMDADRVALRKAARACFGSGIYRAALGPACADLPGASQKPEGRCRTAAMRRRRSARCCSGPIRFTTVKCLILNEADPAKMIGILIKSASPGTLCG